MARQKDSHHLLVFERKSFVAALNKGAFIRNTNLFRAVNYPSNLKTANERVAETLLHEFVSHHSLLFHFQPLSVPFISLLLLAIHHSVGCVIQPRGDNRAEQQRRQDGMELILCQATTARMWRRRMSRRISSIRIPCTSDCVWHIMTEHWRTVVVNASQNVLPVHAMQN